MNESISHMAAVDPIPAEDHLEQHAAEDGKPAGVRFFAFNTEVDIQAYGNPADCTEAFTEACKLCRRYERLFSRTLPHSDIARLNAANGQAVEIDCLTWELLKLAQYYCEESEGAFDISIGPAVCLWNFHEGTVADADALAEAVPHINWRMLRLWTESASKSSPSVSVTNIPTYETASETAEESIGRETPRTDLTYWAQLGDPKAAVDAGGIAKGWIADALVAAMEAHGLSGIIVNLGGNVAVSGTKPDGQPWRVGIRDPRNPDELIGAVPLLRGSAVTSGTYERCITAPDGTFYHHILDPRTGMPVETDTAGVTVICEKSIDAEGFSTTLLALGIKRGIQLVKRHPEILQAFFIDPEGNITAARA